MQSLDTADWYPYLVFLPSHCFANDSNDSGLMIVCPCIATSLLWFRGVLHVNHWWPLVAIYSFCIERKTEALMVVWICRISAQNVGYGFNRKKETKKTKTRRGNKSTTGVVCSSKTPGETNHCRFCFHVDTGWPKPWSAHLELESHKYKM